MADSRVILSLPETLKAAWRQIGMVVLLLVISPLAVYLYHHYYSTSADTILPEDAELGEQEGEGWSLDLAVSLWHPFAIGTGLTILVYVFAQIWIAQNWFDLRPDALGEVTQNGLLAAHVDILAELKLPVPTDYLDDNHKMPVFNNVATLAMVNMYNGPKRLLKRILVPTGVPLNAVKMRAQLTKDTQLVEIARPSNPVSDDFKMYLDAVIQVKTAALGLLHDASLAKAAASD